MINLFLLCHLQEKEIRQLGYILVINDRPILEDIAEVPEFSDEGPQRYIQAVTELSKAFALCAAEEEALAIRRNVTIDWTEREAVRAKLRVMVKRLLKRHGDPPDKCDQATQTVLQQAETLGKGLGHLIQPRTSGLLPPKYFTTFLTSPDPLVVESSQARGVRAIGLRLYPQNLTWLMPAEGSVD